MLGCGIAMLQLTTLCGRLSVLSCCERLFSQMRILEMVFCLAATEMLVCETSGRNDRASSCNHDIDLVIGKALVFC